MIGDLHPPLPVNSRWKTGSGGLCAGACSARVFGSGACLCSRRRCGVAIHSRSAFLCAVIEDRHVARRAVLTTSSSRANRWLGVSGIR